MIHLDDLYLSDRQTAFYTEYDAPPVRRGEILRYSGIPASFLAPTDFGQDDSILRLLRERCARCGKGCDLSMNQGATDDCPTDGEDSALHDLIDEMLSVSSPHFTYRIMYRLLRLDEACDNPQVRDRLLQSADLKKNLSGCDSALLFAATVGSGIDRFIRRFEHTEPAKALILQAVGAERVESLCDRFNRDVTDAATTIGRKTHPRFSPGYGDLPLDVQPLLLTMLDAERRIGITLGNNLLMSPSKSVTALIGLETSN